MQKISSETIFIKEVLRIILLNIRMFSVITMIELLEHVSDPVTAVSECFRLLKENGLLVIQTANMDALQAKCLKDKYAYFMPGHVSYFTKRNLVDLLKKTGFKKVKVFYPVEFGLIPKLLKSRYTLSSFVIILNGSGFRIIIL